MELTKSSCEGFLESLASKAPAPGGGGAAALVGAAGVALGNMVGSLTVGKKKYAAVEAESPNPECPGGSPAQAAGSAGAG